jgi:hypothetical protein
MGTLSSSETSLNLADIALHVYRRENLRSNEEMLGKPIVDGNVDMPVRRVTYRNIICPLSLFTSASKRTVCG